MKANIARTRRAEIVIGDPKLWKTRSKIERHYVKNVFKIDTERNRRQQPRVGHACPHRRIRGQKSEEFVLSRAFLENVQSLDTNVQNFSSIFRTPGFGKQCNLIPLQKRNPHSSVSYGDHPTCQTSCTNVRKKEGDPLEKVIHSPMVPSSPFLSTPYMPLEAMIIFMNCIFQS